MGGMVTEKTAVPRARVGPQPAIDESITQRTILLGHYRFPMEPLHPAVHPSVPGPAKATAVALEIHEPMAGSFRVIG